MPARLEPLAAIGFDQENQFVRFRERKGRKHHSLGDAVNGGIRADAERQD